MNVNSVRSMNTSLKSESLAPWAVACLWDVSSFWQTYVEKTQLCRSLNLRPGTTGTRHVLHWAALQPLTEK